MSALLLSSENSKMFKTIVIALTDFHELTSLQALLIGLEVKIIVGNLNTCVRITVTEYLHKGEALGVI